MPTGWASRGRVAALLLLVAALSATSLGAARPPPSGFASEMALQPCYSGEGRCTSPPVTTSDGRILIQLVPAYVGEVHVFVEDRGASRHAFSCESPSLQLACARIVDTGRAGTYRVTVEFGPTSEGAVLMEVLTPS